MRFVGVPEALEWRNGTHENGEQGNPFHQRSQLAAGLIGSSLTPGREWFSGSRERIDVIHESDESGYCDEEPEGTDCQ